MKIIDHKSISGGIELQLCEDTAGNRSIIVSNDAGTYTIDLFGSREDQLAFAALNVDFDIHELADWVTPEEMEIAIEDAKRNFWGF